MAPRDFDEWVGELCAAVALVAAPRWMPMGELVDAGVTLHGGARGLRSLFTSKPSEKEVERVQRLGAFAVRAMTAVMGTDGPLTEDEEWARKALLASFGLPEGPTSMLVAEPPVAVEALEVPEELDAKLAKAVVRGAWLAAARDGFDPREEEAVLTLAQRLGVQAADAEVARKDVQQLLAVRKGVGDAAIEALRFILSEAEHLPLLERVLRLMLAPSQIDEPRSALLQHAPITFAQRHRLDREGKKLVVWMAWLAALRRNPTLTERAELTAKHEVIVADLDASAMGGEAREELDAFVASELLALMGTASQD